MWRHACRSAIQCCRAYNSRSVINSSFEETLVEGWRQALVEHTTVVELDGSPYPVRLTPKRGLRRVDFIFDGNEIRGLEQNPDTKSEWAKLARSGKKVMQFLSGGRYVAVVVDGRAKLYDDRGL
jgi:hypothetical protein